jgi:hypothetical protein
MKSQITAKYIKARMDTSVSDSESIIKDIKSGKKLTEIP